MSLSRKRIIGLTGTIGTGKSTVIAWLAQRGAQVIDADKVGHAVMEPGQPAFESVTSAFGPSVIGADGRIDRRVLGSLVFKDPAELARLEAILHPAVLTRTREMLEADPAPVAVIEAIKLLEANNVLRLCDEVWVIVVDEQTALARLMAGRGMEEAEARRRLASQSPQSEKVRHPAVTRIIDNNGTPEELSARLEQIWAELTERTHNNL